MSILNPTSAAAERRALAINERRRASVERALSPRMRREINRFAREAGKAYGESGDQVALNLATNAHQERTAALLSRAYAVTIKQTLKPLAEDAKAYAIRETKDVASVIEEVSQRYVEQVAFEQATSIAATSLSQAQAALSVGLSEGLGQNVLGKEIAKTVRSGSQARGALIARTETHNAMINSQYEVVKVSDYQHSARSGYRYQMIEPEKTIDT